MTEIFVRKLDVNGRETWRYRARVVQHNAHWVRLEAFFDRDDLPFQGTVLRRGDRFGEVFFFDRWYNIFAIHDREDDQLKGYYCNIGRPAVWEGTGLAYVDLALDLWVTPDGAMHVLDRDEFAALPLDENTRAQALAALGALQKDFWRVLTETGL